MNILNISPIDVRYHTKVNCLKYFFSEYRYLKFRVMVEIEYFIKLINTIDQLKNDKLDISFKRYILKFY